MTDDRTEEEIARTLRAAEGRAAFEKARAQIASGNAPEWMLPIIEAGGFADGDFYPPAPGTLRLSTRSPKPIRRGSQAWQVDEYDERTRPT
jgi:hypothetical protein